MLLGVLIGCTLERKTDASGLETLSLRYEGSPGNVSLAELADDLGLLAPLRLEFVGNNMTGGPHSIQAVVTGDLDVGGAFNGAIVKLVASKAPLTSVIAAYGTDALNFQGFYALAGSPVQSARDFIGKKVAINTLGAHAEFALREYLARGGLSPEEVRQVTMLVLPASNGEQALRGGQVDVACLGTIFRDRALARGGIQLVFSDYQLFGSFNAGSTVMSHQFIQKHPNTVRKYVEGVAEALAWTHARSREDVVDRLESIIAKRGRNEDNSVVKYWTSYTIATERGAMDAKDFQIWIDWLVRDGQLGPDQIKPADIYTNRFQRVTLASEERPAAEPEAR
jgi:ABC-type nitrate/sulfonate/bicarbonate transport system substrate-binding protein